jgi:hypothetical protein
MFVAEWPQWLGIRPPFRIAFLGLLVPVFLEMQ